MIDLTMMYFAIAAIMYLIGGFRINGGNAESEFYFKNYIGEEKLRVIASFLWLPLLIIFILRGGR